LKEQSQSTTRRRKGLGGKAVVAFQMMLSTVLVAGALLFVRTLMNLGRVDPGFRTDHLLFAVQPPSKRYPHPAEIELHRRIEEKLRALPGVDGITLAQAPYLSNWAQNDYFLPEGERKDSYKDAAAWINVVSPGFFPTLGIPILAGRDFSPSDTASAKHVAVISALLAKRAFPGADPIGRHFYSHASGEHGEGAKLIEVVGVCGDVRFSDLKTDPVGMFYEPYAQAEDLDNGMTYEIRTRMEPSEMAPAIRRAVQAIDADLPLTDLRTQQEQIDATMQTERIFAALTAGFGFLALALACVGVYGVMAYSVARRTNEIGIRLALGALPRQVHAMVLREASWLGIAGIGAGVGAALLLTRVVKSMLFGLQPTDPWSLVGAVALLAAVGLAASWIPARRASGVEPVVALRHE
jgi:predicted permease